MTNISANRFNFCWTSFMSLLRTTKNCHTEKNMNEKINKYLCTPNIAVFFSFKCRQINNIVSHGFHRKKYLFLVAFRQHSVSLIYFEIELDIIYFVSLNLFLIFLGKSFKFGELPKWRKTHTWCNSFSTLSFRMTWSERSM